MLVDQRIALPTRRVLVGRAMTVPSAFWTAVTNFDAHECSKSSREGETWWFRRSRFRTTNRSHVTTNQ